MSNVINSIKNLFGRGKDEHEAQSYGSKPAIQGQESVESTLPTKTISFIFCPKTELLTKHSQTFANELKVPITIVRKDLQRILANIRDDLTCCIEYPYVDEYYRDTYYSFYARKHFSYNRYCFRISFFKNVVTEQNYFHYAVDDAYYGYMVLRPTPRRIIGYTFLSPKVYKENQFSICQCEHLTSVMGRKQVTSAFPFCGQDGEMALCAETSVLMMFDYFSRRYNRYSRTLPHSIASALADNFSDRLQPSRGLDVETVNSIVVTLGMNTRRIEMQTEGTSADEYIVFPEERFKRLLHIYVESGFPLYAVTKSHAFLIVGRENKLFYQDPKLITINDQQYPYYCWEPSDEDKILSFVIPLPENVLLDADKIDPVEIYDEFHHDSNTPKILQEGVDYYHRIFLTTSRAFKQYIVASNIADTSKRFIVRIAMPRFVWVCETLRTEDITENIGNIPVISTLLLDATVFPTDNNHLLLVKTQDKMIRPADDNMGKIEKGYIIENARETLYPFNNNLKGNHNNWLG